MSCNSSTDNDQNGSDERLNLSASEFDQLLFQVADGWNRGDAQSAADCFADDAVYIEPPDKQLYRGKAELYEFFGGDEGRDAPMSMTWHNRIFDEERQVGTGEYTFGYRGRLTHGIVIVKVRNGKIWRWREYQYRTEMDWNKFIGESDF
jgi:ketosteroid isomerase-like protein